MSGQIIGGAWTEQLALLTAQEEFLEQCRDYDANLTNVQVEALDARIAKVRATRQELLKHFVENLG